MVIECESGCVVDRGLVRDRLLEVDGREVFFDVFGF